MPQYLGNVLTPLVGRERELLALEARLAKGARLVTLLGPGGSGKTRLARELVERRRNAGAEAYFVDLVGLIDPSLLPGEIATELGVTETAELDAASVVIHSLRERSAVLVLDNLEELTGARDFLARLVTSTPALQVVSTSRVPLGIAGETEFQVPPLDVPQGDDADSIEASPAGALFLERARSVGRLDEITVTEAKAIADLCRRLDGLPLALELAAARTRILPPASILRHLDKHNAGLLTKRDERDVRHESLRAVLNWSINLLESNETNVLEAVAICPGGFDFAIAEALAPDCDVLNALDVLASHGLVTRRPAADEEPWFQLLETIRVAALDRVDPLDASRVWRRLAKHLADRVSGTLDAFYRLDMDTFRQLDLLLDDVRAVLDWSLANAPELNLAIANEMCWYWHLRGRCREGILRIRAAIGANPEPSVTLAWAYRGLSWLELMAGTETERRRAATEASRIGHLVSDVQSEAAGLTESLITFDDADEIERVRARLRRILPRVTNPAARYQSQVALVVRDVSGPGPEADQAIAAMLDLERDLSDTPYRFLKGVAAGNLANLCLFADRPRDAMWHALRALKALDGVGSETLGWLYAALASAQAGSGETTAAINSLKTGLGLVIAGQANPFDVASAVVVVLAGSDAPLLAAKTWGALSEATLSDPDRSLMERVLVPARRRTDPVAFEVAMRSGAESGLTRVLEEVQLHLIDPTYGSTTVAPARPRHGTLTPREIEILGMVGAGKSDQEIAEALYISSKTASVHISNAKAKLGLETRLEAALWAREQGLVHRDRTAP